MAPVDLSLVSPHILELYRAFREPVRFTGDDLGARNEAPRPEDVGSNNWVVSGVLTRSGKPMMANDPHRTQAVPSLRYWVHLVAPGWNVIGGGEPMLPGVSIGHNEHGAWGLTIFGSDGEDLYVYETNPANANQYRYRGGWEGMRLVEETIPVKGQAPARVALKYTRHLFPEGYPQRDTMHYMWADPFRAMRINEALAPGRDYGVADMVRLQNDDLAIPARTLIPLLREVDLTDPRARRARDLLLGWDAVAGMDSVPAGIYEMWLRRIRARVVGLRLPKSSRAGTISPSTSRGRGSSPSRKRAWC